MGQLYKAAAAGYDQAVKSEFRQTIIEDIMEIDRKTISMEMKEHIVIGGKIRPIHILNNRQELRFCAWKIAEAYGKKINRACFL